MALGGLVLFVGGCSGTETVTVTTGLQQELVAEATGQESGENPAEFISLCANCHDRLDRELDWRRERKLVFNHPAHFAKGIRCAACHQEFPHKPGRILHVSVETCFTCHGTIHGQGGELAPTGCDVCHTADIATITPDHKQAAWVLQPGAGGARHARAALERRLYCKMCHEDSFCESCHQTQVPHPEDWVPVAHQQPAQQVRAACLMCHESQQYCDECHHSAFDKLPDWGTQHEAVVTVGGAESCFECHEPVVCANCHVDTGKKRGVLGG